MNRTTFTLIAASLAVLTGLPAQAAHGPRMLQRADLNHDGVIERGELDQVRVQRFERLDTNRDGYLDGNEWTRQLMGPASPQAAPPWPGRWGGPGAGPGAGPSATPPWGAGPQGPHAVAPWGRGSAMAPGGRHGGGRYLARLDRDGDGRVSREEFMGRPHPLFDRVDLNRDGRLTGDELAALPARPCRRR